MDGFLTRQTVERVKEILLSPQRREEMINTNFDVAGRHYSYHVLRRWLNTLLINFFGTDG
jgi:hypothetical protein